MDFCVVKYSAPFEGEQLHGVITGVSKALRCLGRLSVDLTKLKARWTETQIRNKIQRWLSAQFMVELGAYTSLDRQQDRVHAFYCMLGISLLQYVHRQAQAASAGISMEKLLEELRQIQEFVLLYPPQGDKGPNRVATVLSQQTRPQQALAKTRGLEQLRIIPRR